MVLGVTITERTTPFAPAGTGRVSAIGIAGTDEEMGHAKIPEGELVAVTSEAEALDEFGNEGSLIEAWYAIEHQQPSIVVGSRFDDTLAGGARITAAENAVGALDMTEADTDYILIGAAAPLETVTITGGDPTDDANGVVTALDSLASAIRCVGVADAAWDEAGTAKGDTAIDWTANNSGDRIASCYPRLKYSGRALAQFAMSPALLGIMARNDATALNGVAQSVGNRPIRGAIFADAAIPFGIAAADLNQRLAAAGLTTAVREEGVLKTFGGRLGASEPAYSFVGGRRIVDEAYRSIRRVLDPLRELLASGDNIERGRELGQAVLSGMVAARKLASGELLTDTVFNENSTNIAAFTIQYVMRLGVRTPIGTINVDADVSVATGT